MSVARDHFHRCGELCGENFYPCKTAVFLELDTFGEAIESMSGRCYARPFPVARATAIDDSPEEP